MEVDFESDAVWEPGEGAAIRKRDRLAERVRREDEGGRGDLLGIFVEIIQKL